MKGLGLVLVAAIVALSFWVMAPASSQSNCDRAYPNVCIPSPPPDLNCKDVSYRNFKVLQPDPHRFDRDKDGIGCEEK
ncbi:MAG TPA: excalibur calcium-binding domain-containing protein [Leptolyngbyaceae cyanobacterium M33_DOE_097]|uniref:Excalibur calcium-binding domain-containing protein n=1 Tax=Oscillatoriales cyanobacterium SpSt-418 TaxID=2282169 RepID=A0A7C3KJ15_9CYAN|nr:excalibur calcium-binding domain-containing protein [Leptolyngbyaceae cyanobacterium M33_DOE_097]